MEISHAIHGEPPTRPFAPSFSDFARAKPSNDLEALAACILGPQPDPDPARLDAITNQVLVVVGDQDDVAIDGERLVESIPSARLVNVMGRNHMSTVPAKEFKAAVLEFLAG